MHQKPLDIVDGIEEALEVERLSVPFAFKLEKFREH